MQKWLLCSLVILLHVSTVWAQESSPNRVLFLDGDEDYVEMADSEALNDIGSQVTMEAWIRVAKFSSQYVNLIQKQDEVTAPNLGNRSYLLYLKNDGAVGLASAPRKQGQITITSSEGLVALNAWYHLAGVVDTRKGFMRLFAHGIEVAHRDSGKNIYASTLPLRIGIAGEMDEVRIWNVARNQEEIQATMYQSLSGREPGLVGYWRFNSVSNTVTDSSPSGAHGKLVGDAHLVEVELPGLDKLVIPTVISGMVVDESGQPVSGALVQLKQNGEEIAQGRTGVSGHYRIALPQPAGGIYNFYATSGENAYEKLSVPISQGESRELNFTLKGPIISISGQLLMLDDKTPHVVVPVQALRDGEVVATKLTDKTGKYRLINLEPGRYQVRCQILGGYVYYEKGGDGKRSEERRVGKECRSRWSPDH